MRPLIHFTPPGNWLNDPNGLVYHAGEYHLFYQHHPHSPDWGPMHWGHAVSRDLIHWQHLSIALAPDDDGMIFSGSAVVDWRNTAGFGPQALVAIYTCHKEPGHIETQCLAFSHDHGRAWQKYPGNPVLPNPGLRDFRDPKVFWHADRWVMCLAAGREIHLYTAPNLRDWTLASIFAPQDSLLAGAVWETPDLFELPVTGSHQTRWVLTLGVNAGAPAGGSGACYFIGQFDGSTFIPDQPSASSAVSDPSVASAVSAVSGLSAVSDPSVSPTPPVSPLASASPADSTSSAVSEPSVSPLPNPLPNPLPLWMDYGPDFYAPQTWSDAPNARRICLGWMSNWRYAPLTPADSWRGMFSLPRELILVETDAGLRLAQRPITEINTIRRKVFSAQGQTLRPEENPFSGIQASVWDVEAEIVPFPAARFGFRIHTAGGGVTHILFDCAQHTITLDRSRSGRVDFHPDFAAPVTAPLPFIETLSLRLVVDTLSIELFAADGRVALSAAIFPADAVTRLEMFTEADVILRKLDIFEIGPL